MREFADRFPQVIHRLSTGDPQSKSRTGRAARLALQPVPDSLAPTSPETPERERSWHAHSALLYLCVPALRAPRLIAKGSAFLTKSEVIKRRDDFTLRAVQNDGAADSHDIDLGGVNCDSFGAHESSAFDVW